jgi:hypothetical protein
MTVVHGAADEKSKGCGVELGPGCLVSMSVCGGVQWVKLTDSWPKIKLFLFHKTLNLREGQKKAVLPLTYRRYKNICIYYGVKYR